MKKLILFLILLISTAIFAQTGERYEKFVGFSKGKYPLTLGGLKSAINSLDSDSGTVTIAYPGIDTIGLGIIPSNVKLDGWLKVCYDMDYNTYAEGYIRWRLSSTAHFNGGFVIIRQYLYEIPGFVYDTLAIPAGNTIAQVYNILYQYFLNDANNGFTLQQSTSIIDSVSVPGWHQMYWYFKANEYGLKSTPVLIKENLIVINTSLNSVTNASTVTGALYRCNSSSDLKIVNLRGEYGYEKTHDIYDSSIPLNEIINHVYESGGGLIVFHPNTYTEQLFLSGRSGIDFYFMPGAKMKVSSGNCISINNTNTNIYGYGVFETTSQSHHTIAVYSGNVYIEADSIISSGIVSNPNTVSNACVYTQTTGNLTINANYVIGKYNCGIYSNGTVNRLELNIKKLETGIQGIYTSGSTALITRADTSFVNIKEIRVNNIGHCFSHRGGHLEANIDYMYATNNRSNIATGITMFVVQQGSGNQTFNLTFKEIHSLKPDTMASIIGSSCSAIDITQGTWGNIKGKLIYIEDNPDAVYTADILAIGHSTSNDNYVLNFECDSTYVANEHAIYINNVSKNKKINIKNTSHTTGIWGSAGSTPIWFGDTTGTLSIINSTIRNLNTNGNGLINMSSDFVKGKGKLYFENTVFDNRNQSGYNIFYWGGVAPEKIVTIKNLYMNRPFSDATNFAATTFKGNPETLYQWDANLNRYWPVFEPRKYVALLNQTAGNAPIATVIENTLGVEVTWARADAGNYTGSVGTPVFTGGKTIFQRSTLIDVAGDAIIHHALISNDTTQLMRVTTKVFTIGSSNINTDGLLNDFLFEVRVYP